MRTSGRNCRHHQARHDRPTQQHRLKSTLLPPEKAKEISASVESALRKYRAGASLTDHEWLLVQYELGGGRCHSCGAPRTAP